MKVIHFNIDPMDLQSIEKMVRNSNAITTIWSVDEFDRYRLGAYVKETEIEGSRFFAMLDHNMFSRIIGIAKNRGRKPLSSQQKVACALLAFLQLAEVAIEPNHATYEIMDSCDDDAIDKLSLFRAFNNLDPQILIELALGRRDEIPADMLKCQAVEYIEQKKGEGIPRWRIHRGFALKLAIIARHPVGSPFDKIERFLDWVYEEYNFIGSGTIFGLVFFSNKFSGMLKDFNDRNKDKVLKGVRNATWDMTVVYTWSYLAMKEKAKGVVWLLCTEDNALRAVAGSLIVTGNELEQKKKAMFCEYMGEAKGKQIYDKLIDMYKRKDSDSSRRANTFDNNSDLYPVVDELEKELLSELANQKN
jgi:hypothetical protein